MTQFAFGVARNVYLETVGQRVAAPLDESHPAPPNNESALLCRDILRLVSPSEASLLRAYYGDGRTEVVQEQLNPALTRLRVFRIIRKLRASMRLADGAGKLEVNVNSPQQLAGERT